MNQCSKVDWTQATQVLNEEKTFRDPPKEKQCGNIMNEMKQLK